MTKDPTQAPITSGEALKPCPFCGSSRIVMSTSEYGLDMAMCEDCTAEGPAMAGNNSRAAAAEAWNRRAALASQPKADVPGGEMLPLPKPAHSVSRIYHTENYYTADQMHAYVLADRAQRASAVAAPASHAAAAAFLRAHDKLNVLKDGTVGHTIAVGAVQAALATPVAEAGARGLYVSEILDAWGKVEPSLPNEHADVYKLAVARKIESAVRALFLAPVAAPPAPQEVEQARDAGGRPDGCHGISADTVLKTVTLRFETSDQVLAYYGTVSALAAMAAQPDDGGKAGA